MSKIIDKIAFTMKTLGDLPLVIKQSHKINTLQNQIDTLEDSIKSELYKEFMKKLGEPLEVDRYKKENKRLRIQVRSLKDIIKEGK